eukprot:SM000050S17049  [mRNA]  locus=s50:599048:605013:+ [translate_table: standard]
MVGGKKLINDPANVVVEMIEGLVETYPHLQYLDGFPEVKVVLRADIERKSNDKVALISGGGAGHEPAHAGFVGKGMLTAAVCGDVFTSPTTNAVLAAIRAVTGPPGCLLIVKNYTGDRLNFGLAAEQAKAEGYKVEMVIVADDCALPPPRGLAGRRGLAGTLFVHKGAGAAAEAGLSLADVAGEARHLATLMGTAVVGLSSGSMPGGINPDRLGPDQMELGQGIHGEPGLAVTELQPADVVVTHMLKQILSPETGYLAIKAGSKVALLVNGMGATPLMELMICAGKAVAELQVEHGFLVERVFVGSLMTSLDMAGISITVLKVDDGVLQRLDAPTSAPAWPVACSGPRPPTTVPIPLPPAPADDEPSSERPKELTDQGRLFEAAIRSAAEAIIEIAPSLNDWDSKVGDGDCGSTLSKGAHAILDSLSSYSLNSPAATVKGIGDSIRLAMGGTSGVLYDIFCRAAYAHLRDVPKGQPSASHWSSALEAAVRAVGIYGGAQAGYRTILDALIPASTTLRERLAAGEGPITAFLAAADAAEAGAEATKGLQAQAGRSSYVPPEVLHAVPDPGAKAAAAWLTAAATAVAANSKPAR